MSSVRRLQAIYEGKQQEWEATHDRLTSLRQARTIETDPENQFKLDRRVKVIEQELKVIQDELNQIEHQLELLGSTKDKSTPEQVTQTSFVQEQRRERSDSRAYKSYYKGKSIALSGVLLSLLAGSFIWYRDEFKAYKCTCTAENGCQLNSESVTKGYSCQETGVKDYMERKGGLEKYQIQGFICNAV